MLVDSSGLRSCPIFFSFRSASRIHNVSGEYLAKNGISTFACSETQKFGHVTFFWNGNRSGYFDAKLETYLEVGV